MTEKDEVLEPKAAPESVENTARPIAIGIVITFLFDNIHHNNNPRVTHNGTT